MTFTAQNIAAAWVVIGVLTLLSVVGLVRVVVDLRRSNGKKMLFHARTILTFVAAVGALYFSMLIAFRFAHEVMVEDDHIQLRFPVALWIV